MASIDTVNDLPPRVQYVASVGQTVFPYPFPIFADADIVAATDGSIDALNADYTVDGEGDDLGGNLTYTVPKVGGEVVTIYRDIAIERDTDISQNGPWSSRAYNDDQDKIFLILQQLEAQIARSIRLPILAQVDDADLELNVAAFADKYVTLDAFGKPVPALLSATTITAQILGAFIYPLRQSEIDAGAVPVDYTQPYGWIFRYKTNAIPGTTDMADAFQNAIDSADSTYPEVRFTGDVAISKPLLIRPTTTQSISIIGTGRVSSNLMPLTADIKVAAQNINCMIFNQINNGHLRLENFRWLTAVPGGFTGVFLYAKEGGGADASGQACFSMIVKKFWGAPQSTNSGCFQGGFSNLQTDSCVYESVKTGVWMLEGAGNSDHHHSNITLNSSFDSYIYASTDTLTKAILRVNGLHAYQYLRGAIIEGKNIVGLQCSDISLEADAGNFGGVSLYKLTDCKDINIGKSTATIANGTPRIACGIELIGACTGRVQGLLVNATVGIRISGAGALDVSFENNSFTGCQYAFQHLSGNASGALKFNNNKLNNSEYGMLTSTGAPTYTIDFIGGEIMNAGYDGTAPGVTTGRNVTLSHNGATIRFVRTKIGHDTALATATHRFNMTGTGTVLVQDPYLVGVPPTAFSQGTQALSLDGVDSTMPGMTQFVPSLGGTTTYSVQTGSWSLKGGRVHFSGEITVTTLGTGSTSVVSGLPLTVGAGTPGVGYVAQFSSLAVSPVSLGLLCTSGGTAFTMKGLTAAAAATATLNVFGNGANVRFAGSYQL